jgi:hypothetical protein
MLMASNFCIPKNLVDGFLERLKSGEINPEKLNEMTSKERNAYFASFLGETNATKVNALFESKMLLKNQQQGLINWAKQLTGIKPVAKRDLLTRIENMTEVLQPQDAEKFYADLAAQRLGVGVSVEEAGRIADLAKDVTAKKSLITEDMPNGSTERMDYGTALVAMQEYVGGLKADAKALSLGELMRSPGQIIQTISGGMKSAKASMDASFALRQGFVTLLTKPKVWSEAFVKSFDAWGKELQGIDGITPVKAEIFSRKNALNGNYKKIGVDIGIDTEEAFPESWPTKIPLLGRLYKASMSAYNGALIRMRADLADRFIEDAMSQGVTDLAESGIGRLVNSMTGRGAVHLTKPQAKAINASVFSIKYFKSQLDVLTAGATDKKLWGTPAHKTAAQNLLRMVGIIGGMLATAKALDPDSVDLDPRSTKFGKIYVPIGNKRVGVDVTAGFRSLIILASRIIPTTHRGKPGLWWKDSRGRHHNMWEAKFGEPSLSDFIVRFMQGKASPAARTVLNLWEQKKWDGEKPTLKGEAIELFSPISITNATKTLKETEGENLLIRLILGGLNMLGAGTETPKR